MTMSYLILGIAVMPAIGAIASVLDGSGSNDKKPADEDGAPGEEQRSASSALNSEVEVLRALHLVTIIGPKDEGTGVNQLPGGIYGFTYSPLNTAPLFSQRATQSFEVHKLPDGAVHLIGFVSEEQSKQISSGGELLDVQLYPEPWEESFAAVSVPLSRIRRLSAPSRSDGNSVTMDLGRDDSTVQ
jgi:hypothetical protein